MTSSMKVNTIQGPVVPKVRAQLSILQSARSWIKKNGKERDRWQDVKKSTQYRGERQINEAVATCCPERKKTNCRRLNNHEGNFQ